MKNTNDSTDIGFLMFVFLFWVKGNRCLVIGSDRGLKWGVYAWVFAHRRYPAFVQNSLYQFFSSFPFCKTYQNRYKFTDKQDKKELIEWAEKLF